MGIAQKLKIKENTLIVVVNGPANYAEMVGDLPKGAAVTHQLVNDHPFVHLFVRNKAELVKEIDTVISATAPGGLIWISYPKGTSKIQTDLNRDKGWEILEKYKLQWATLISIDTTWSAFCLKNLPEKGQSKASKNYHDTQNEWADPVNKVVKLPQDLEAAFSKNTKAWNGYNALSYSNKKEYVMWIASAKHEETRAERVRKTIEKLLEGKKNPAEK